MLHIVKGNRSDKKQNKKETVLKNTHVSTDIVKAIVKISTWDLRPELTLKKP